MHLPPPSCPVSARLRDPQAGNHIDYNNKCPPWIVSSAIHLNCCAADTPARLSAHLATPSENHCQEMHAARSPLEALEHVQSSCRYSDAVLGSKDQIAHGLKAERKLWEKPLKQSLVATGSAAGCSWQPISAPGRHDSGGGAAWLCCEAMPRSSQLELSTKRRGPERFRTGCPYRSCCV